MSLSHSRERCWAEGHQNILDREWVRSWGPGSKTAVTAAAGTGSTPRSPAAWRLPKTCVQGAGSPGTWGTGTSCLPGTHTSPFPGEETRLCPVGQGTLESVQKVAFCPQGTPTLPRAGLTWSKDAPAPQGSSATTIRTFLGEKARLQAGGCRLALSCSLAFPGMTDGALEPSKGCQWVISPPGQLTHL